MRRVPVLVLVMLVSLVGVVALGHPGPTRAQQATPIAASPSPLIGSWQLDTDTEDPSNPPEIATVYADGSYLEVAVDGVGSGRWESTGADSANLNIWFLQTDDHGNYTGTTIVRALVHLNADGQSFDADYTLELMQPDGIDVRSVRTRPCSRRSPLGRADGRPGRPALGSVPAVRRHTRSDARTLARAKESNHVRENRPPDDPGR